MTPPTFSLTKSGAAATFTSSQDGVYVFYVTATDPSGARSPWAPVKILVLPTLAQPVDADKDGYPTRASTARRRRPDRPPGRPGDLR